MGGRVPGGLPRGIAVLSAAALLGLAAALPAAAQPVRTDPPVAPTSTRIVGGTAAEISDYPWVVALTTKAGLFCGGTLTAPDEVVTAAHCAQAYPATQVEVIAGRTKLTGKGGTVVKVTRFEVHPEWNPITLYGDIAVARLAEPLTGPTLPLATGADSALYTAGTVGTVLGWGRTSENGSLSKGLRQAELPITSDSSCKLAYPVGFNARSSFCAGYAKGEIDSCQGDSGGPFVVEDKLVGIVSYGEGCARPGRPGIYTRVSAFSE